MFFIIPLLLFFNNYACNDYKIIKSIVHIHKSIYLVRSYVIGGIIYSQSDFVSPRRGLFCDNDSLTVHYPLHNTHVLAKIRVLFDRVFHPKKERKKIPDPIDNHCGDNVLRAVFYTGSNITTRP